MSSMYMKILKAHLSGTFPNGAPLRGVTVPWLTSYVMKKTKKKQRKKQKKKKKQKKEAQEAEEAERAEETEEEEEGGGGGGGGLSPISTPASADRSKYVGSAMAWPWPHK